MSDSIVLPNISRKYASWSVDAIPADFKGAVDFSYSYSYDSRQRHRYLGFDGLGNITVLHKCPDHIDLTIYVMVADVSEFITAWTVAHPDYKPKHFQNLAAYRNSGYVSSNLHPAIVGGNA